MNDSTLLPVNYNNKTYQFPIRIVNFGYVAKIEIEIDETKVLFERDDEHNWRAGLSYEDTQAGKKIDGGLLQAIAEVIEQVMK
jgi:hypothetical protein